MNFTNKHNIFIPFIFLFVLKTNSQIITPYTFNMGGGYSDYFIMEWSIGESASIANFLTIDNALNTGLLQPKNRAVKIINVNGSAVFGNQIMIYPNPTPNIFYFKGNFNTTGDLKLQISNNNSSLLITHDAGKVNGRYLTSFSLDKYPSDIYYLKVYFKPEIGNAKIGIYKLMKIVYKD